MAVDFPLEEFDFRGKICGDRRIILPPSIYINFKDVKSEHMHAFALPFQYRMNWYRWGWKREGKYAIALPLSRRSKFFVGTEGRWENKKDRASPPPLPRNIENYSAGEDKDDVPSQLPPPLKQKQMAFRCTKLWEEALRWSDSALTPLFFFYSGYQRIVENKKTQKWAIQISMSKTKVSKDEPCSNARKIHHNW